MPNADKYIGYPFESYGRGPEHKLRLFAPFSERDKSAGFDCYGLVYHFYKYELGIDLPKCQAVSYYDAMSKEEIQQLRKDVERNSTAWKQVEKPDIFDVVKTNVIGTVPHIGLIVSPTKMLHVMQPNPVLIEIIDSFSWRNRITGYFHYAG